MKSLLIRISFLFLLAAVAAASISGCGTVRGFGRDVEAVGGNIEESTR